MSLPTFGPDAKVSDVLDAARGRVPVDRLLDRLTGAQWDDLLRSIMFTELSASKRRDEVRTVPAGAAQLRLVAEHGELMVPQKTLRRTPYYRQPGRRVSTADW